LHGVAVPRPEWELAILAIRILLKYRARDAVKDVLGIRTPGIRPPVAAELRWLLAQTTSAGIAGAIRDVPVLPTDVVLRFVETVRRPGRHGLAMVRLRRRLRRALEHHQRGSRVRAHGTGARVRWRELRRRRFGGAPARMTLLHGGATVAFVGADGAGKSTLAEASARWLSWKLDARVHYLGSKPPSRASAALYLLFRALRRSERAATRHLGGGAFVAHTVRTTRDVALASHYLAVARQRERARTAGLRDAASGRVVLFDRYPFEQLPSARARQLFDGSQIATAVPRSDRLVIASLARAEARIYERFQLPDVVVLLDVDPRVASRRKPDHDAGVIFEKARAAAAIVDLVAGAGSTLVRVDSTLPLDAVMDVTKTAVWDAL
jgi:thymidylate kinase